MAERELIKRAGAVTDAIRLLGGESGDWKPAGKARAQYFLEVQEAADALDRVLIVLARSSSGRDK